jgi:hypothetical protein
MQSGKEDTIGSLVYERRFLFCDPGTESIPQRGGLHQRAVLDAVKKRDQCPVRSFINKINFDYSAKQANVIFCHCHLLPTGVRTVFFIIAYRMKNKTGRMQKKDKNNKITAEF